MSDIANDLRNFAYPLVRIVLPNCCHHAHQHWQGATEGRYHPAAAALVDNAEALSGAVHYVRIAQQECERQLSKAVAAFRPFSVTRDADEVEDDNDGDAFVDSEDEAAYVPPAAADDTA